MRHFVGLGQETAEPIVARSDELALYDHARAIEKERKLIERWLRFYPENPTIWQLFERFSLQAFKPSRKHFGGFCVINRIRWFTDVESEGDDFKISNDWSPFYTRLFREKHPEHSEFFAFEKAAADLVFFDRVIERFGA